MSHLSLLLTGSIQFTLLLRLLCSFCPVLPWKSACKTGVATRQPTQRGCRGGARKQRAIQVIVRGRLMTPARSLDQLNRGRHLNTIALRTTTPNLKVMLQNTRSICNKVSVVTENIIDAGADVSFLTETWLRSDHQQIVNDLTLPGFELKTIKSTWQARWRSVCLTQKLPQVCMHCGRDANTFRTLAIVVQQAIVSLCLNIQAASIQCSRFSRRIRESGDYPSYYPGRTADPRRL